MCRVNRKLLLVIMQLISTKQHILCPANVNWHLLCVHTRIGKQWDPILTGGGHWFTNCEAVNLGSKALYSGSTEGVVPAAFA